MILWGSSAKAATHRASMHATVLLTMVCSCCSRQVHDVQDNQNQPACCPEAALKLNLL